MPVASFVLPPKLNSGTREVDALRLGDGQELGDQQGRAANQRDVLKPTDLADLPDDVGAFFLEEGEKEAIRTARRNPGEDGGPCPYRPC